MSRIRKNGYVYLIQYDNTHFKVGESKDIPTRFKRLTKRKKGSIIHIIETDDTRRLESYFHQMFSSKLVADEIFNLSSEDILQFKQDDKVIYDPSEYCKEPNKKESFDEKWNAHLKYTGEVFEKEINIFNYALEEEIEFLLTKFSCMTKEEAKEISQYYLLEFFNNCIFSRHVRNKSITFPFLAERNRDSVIGKLILQEEKKI